MKKKLDTSDYISSLKTKISYLNPSEHVGVLKALDFAAKKHDQQFRYSKEPYIIHVISTAITLADMKLDHNSIIAGLLHDTLEDTSATEKEIMDNFGLEVFTLVDGVTKVGHIRLQDHHLDNEQIDKIQELESLRKLFLAMAKDLRVVLIKLADRLHNIKTLEFIPQNKQLRIAKETMEIYVPLANRLGLWEIKSELEDYSFKYIKPDEYIKIYQEVSQKTSKGKLFIEKAIKEIKKHLIKSGLLDFEIYGRTKNLYGIYSKTLNKQKTIDEIYDIYAIRIITKNLNDCYASLGVIHNLWRPIPGRFKDYIAVPKTNGYQSLHTSVFAFNGKKIEIQIRTQEMHDHAEKGIAAHWLYKEKNKSKNNFDWVLELSNIKNIDSSELSNELKIDIFEDRIFVYTPKGDIKDLPKGSTPIDFAYSIHTDVGNKLIGAKINTRIVPLDHVLKNGDIVDIIISKSSLGPKRQWLEIAKTNFAKSKIRSFLKKINSTEKIKEGTNLLNNELAKLNLPTVDNIPGDKIKKLLDLLPYKNINDILASIGQGEFSTRKILKIIYPNSEIFKQKNITQVRTVEKNPTITFGQNQTLPYKLAENCCKPSYQDFIIGYITRGQGINVHKLNCKNVSSKDPSRLIIAHWKKIPKYKYIADISIISQDRVGMLHDITSITTQANINLLNIQVTNSKEKSNNINMILTINIKDIEQLSNLIDKIKSIQGVISANKI